MSQTYSGELSAPKNVRVAVVVSRFNGLITAQLLSGAMDGLTRSGVDTSRIDTFWVPGAFEIPAIAGRIAVRDKYQGILCLGAVVRGATPHFDMVAGQSARGIADVATRTAAAVIYAVLTTDSIEQALERAGTKAGNKGFDGALALVEMMSLHSKIDKL